jgi:hypothetical protein
MTWRNDYIKNILYRRDRSSVIQPLSNEPKKDTERVGVNRDAAPKDIRNLVVSARKNKGAVDQVKQFLNQDGNFYVTFGGVGDFILILAEAYKDPMARIIYFSNNTGRSFTNEIINFFQIPTLVTENVMGTSNANKIMDIIRGTGRLKPSQHLSDTLNYDDWKDKFALFKQKMTLKTDWKERFGNFQKPNKLAVLAPSGSFKSVSPQKYLAKDELARLINIFDSKGYDIYCVGSFTDKEFYGTINKPNVYWMSSNMVINFRGQKQPILCQDFFKIINSADKVCSVDTWLKTYTCLCGINTDVFYNRTNGVSRWGDMAGDYIFLNPQLWETMKLHDFNEYIKNNAYLN